MIDLLPPTTQTKEIIRVHGWDMLAVAWTCSSVSSLVQPEKTPDNSLQLSLWNTDQNWLASLPENIQHAYLAGEAEAYALGKTHVTPDWLLLGIWRTCYPPNYDCPPFKDNWRRALQEDQELSYFWHTTGTQRKDLYPADLRLIQNFFLSTTEKRYSLFKRLATYLGEREVFVFEQIRELGLLSWWAMDGIVSV